MSLNLNLEDQSLQLILQININEDSNIEIFAKCESKAYQTQVTLQEISEANKFLELIVKGSAENFLKLIERCAINKTYNIIEDLGEKTLEITFKHNLFIIEAEEITFGFILRQTSSIRECGSDCSSEIQALKTLFKDYKQQSDENTKFYKKTFEDLIRKKEELNNKIEHLSSKFLDLIIPQKIKIEEGEKHIDNIKLICTIKAKSSLNQTFGVFEFCFYMQSKGITFPQFSVGLASNDDEDVKNEGYFFHISNGNVLTSSYLKCGFNEAEYSYKIKVAKVMTVRVDLNSNFLHFYDGEYGPFTLIMNNLKEVDKSKLTPFIQYHLSDKFIFL